VSQTQAPLLPGCALERRRGVAVAFPVLFFPGERDVAFFEPRGNQQDGRWVLEGVFCGTRQQDWGS